jgi:hypothetical protein
MRRTMRVSRGAFALGYLIIVAALVACASPPNGSAGAVMPYASSPNAAAARRDGQFFALDDRGSGAYQVALIHGQPFWVNQTQFDNPYVASAQYAIYEPNPKRRGKEILVGFNDESYNSGVDYYPYPDGGESGPTFTHGLDGPFAVTISLAK